MGKTLTRPKTDTLLKPIKAKTPPRPKEPEPPSLIDEALVPELYEGKWRAKKKITSCFDDKNGDPVIAQAGEELTASILAPSAVPPSYVLKNHRGNVVAVSTKDRLKDLCER